MVMMSNWPPLVAMSVVTRWRRTFSSSTTQFSLMPVAASNFGDSFCMMIMSELLTVAIFSVVCATAGPAASAPIMASAVLAPASKYVLFIIVPPHLGDVLTRRLLRPISRRSRLPYRLPPCSHQLRARRSQPAGPCSSATFRCNIPMTEAPIWRRSLSQRPRVDGRREKRPAYALERRRARRDGAAQTPWRNLHSVSSAEQSQHG